MPTSLETGKCQAAGCAHVTAHRCAADARCWSLACEFIKCNIFGQTWARTTAAKFTKQKGFGGVKNAHNSFTTSFLRISTCRTWEYADLKGKTKQKKRPETVKIRVRKGLRRALRVRACAWVKSTRPTLCKREARGVVCMGGCGGVSKQLLEAIFPALVFQICIKTSFTWSRPRLNKPGTGSPFEA